MNKTGQLMCYFLKIFLFEDLICKTSSISGSHCTYFVLAWTRDVTFSLLRAASPAEAPLGPTFPSLIEHNHFKAT